LATANGSVWRGDVTRDLASVALMLLAFRCSFERKVLKTLPFKTEAESRFTYSDDISYLQPNRSRGCEKEPIMRKVIFGGANSLDNYFARKDDSVDWLLWSDDLGPIMAEFWKPIDTIVMGRRTYEVAQRMSSGTGGYPGVKSYVFSRTIKAKAGSGVEIISEDAAEFVRKLKNQEGKDICVMGGGLLAKSLFEANVIDEVGFNIHPVLLGSGIPLFYEMKNQIDLELLECRPFKTGCVMVRYRVKPPGEKKKKNLAARKARGASAVKSSQTAKNHKSARNPKVNIDSTQESCLRLCRLMCGKAAPFRSRPCNSRRLCLRSGVRGVASHFSQLSERQSLSAHQAAKPKVSLAFLTDSGEAHESRVSCGIRVYRRS
jgi:dihydrofolate reductase